MTRRRYTDEEVARIFERAASAEAAGAAPASGAEGRTLVELQAIGEEVGIPAELVARAAQSLEEPEPVTGRTLLGFPLAVGRTADLGRRLSDDEWERLVVDLRETFHARGTVRYDGPFRQWTNGNLQALLEPTESGHRLRLSTMKGDARNLMAGGLTLLAVALAIVLTFALTGDLATDWAAAVFPAILGAGMFALGAARVPGWAATRRAQMDAVVERLRISPASPGESPVTETERTGEPL